MSTASRIVKAGPVFLAPNSAPLAAEAEEDMSRTTTRMSPHYSMPSIYLVFGVPAMGGLLFGYDISVTSFAVVQMPQISAFWTGLVVAAASLGAFLGSLLIFRIADRIGRRTELRYGATLYVLGALLEVTSGWILKRGSKLLYMPVLLTGRLIYGGGIACAMHGGPTYIAEMSPREIRGMLVSLKEAVIVLGILLGYTVGYLFPFTSFGWVYAYGCSVPVAMIMLVLSIYSIPSSYRWLMLQGRETDALEAILFVYRDENVALAEWEAMKQSQRIDESTMSEEPSLWEPRYRRPLIAGIGLVLLQQVTGQPTILSYAIPIFQDAGFSDWSSILVAIFKLAATLASTSAVEIYGRKKLLYIGNTFMLVALVVLATIFGLDASSAALQTIIMLAMIVYIGGYQYSFGPITWLIISECFPMAVRGQCVALAVQMNFLFNALVQFSVPLLQSWVGSINAIFGIFAALTAYSLYFVRVHVPETKGLTLEEIESQFDEMLNPLYHRIGASNL